MKTKGNIVISLVFVIFLAFVGISLLTFSIMHTRIVKARTLKLVETDKIYQGLIYYLHHFREKIFAENIRDFNQPEEEYFNTTYFPDSTTVNNEHLITHSFDYFEVPKIGYKKTRVTVTIDVSSTLYNYALNSEVFIDILSGRVPLTVFPFFMNIGSGGQAPVDANTFLKEKNIINKSNKNVVVGDVEVDLDISHFLVDALKITGTNMSWREIREKFGFPLSDEPIPEGIHLLVEEGAVQSVFIQGNVDRMIFSTQDNIQRIRLIKNSVPYELFYKPKETYFQCWDYSIDENILFMEKIIVNGSVWSIQQEGEAAFNQLSDITLLVFGKAVIRSNLETGFDQFSLKESKFSNLKLACGKEYLFDQGNTEPGVVVDTMANQDKTELRVSVIVDGKFTNNSSKLNLSGSLYCKDLENNGVMEINHVNSNTAENNYFSTVDFKYIDQFLIHFIEEV
ncbi:MAG: hypothetical protein JSV88_19810 [Candidatus Aminicenantes bacterium]|nr:MAG: hypothetical protein JSV88_19810 [Candidatus Aminicenantes bacterium]